jgi:type I restriction enzyme M protein
VSSNNGEIEKKLWAAAEELRANSKLKSSEYSTPVLGLIFLRYADHKFALAETELAGKKTSRRTIGKADYQARGVVYLPEKARFGHLINLPESADIGKAINDAMRLIESENEELRDVLPKNYQTLENKLLITLLKSFGSVSMDVDGDVLGRIYEYFLGEFAKAEGSKGGEFYTPTSIVRLIVEIVEPFHGRIFDPACGSGGMFVQSAHFIERHRKNPSDEISIYGQEKVGETVRLCRMNLAVHGLSGDIREGNTYYEDIHSSFGKFDFVMANPPFNVDKVDKERLKGDPRFPFGMPKADNANYIWIQLFASALNERGRAGFVIANTAGDARGMELQIRRNLIEQKSVDVVVAVASNFFYTVILPCALWFLDRNKAGSDRAEQILFIDARHLFYQLDRTHREFTDEHIAFLSGIVRLHRGEELEQGTDDMLGSTFPNLKYRDVPGLCRLVSLAEVAASSWSLNPGRYVGVAPGEAAHPEFSEHIANLMADVEMLTSEARDLEEQVVQSFREITSTPELSP